MSEATCAQIPAALEHLQTGQIDTVIGPVPQIKTTLEVKDHLGSLRVRLGIGRGNYAISPGLYAIGNPNEDAPVIVTANYKLSFDHVRSHLAGRNLWLLVLDTKGINVWCAAGKGTFGTEEVIRRIKEVKLSEIVQHRTVILPQLGAPGVAAHEVRKKSGFRVVYGPVRAADLGQFLDSDLKATPEMRKVRFNALDRLILTPVELSMGLKWILLGMLFIVGISVVQTHFQLATTLRHATPDLLGFLWAIFAGCVLTPLLLPWIPGRAFALKGWLIGIVGAFAILIGQASLGHIGSYAEIASMVLIWPAISAFFAMNFTGASTFTSLSGVKKEMRWAVPCEAASASLGLILWLIFGFLGT